MASTSLRRSPSPVGATQICLPVKYLAWLGRLTRPGRPAWRPAAARPSRTSPTAGVPGGRSNAGDVGLEVHHRGAVDHVDARKADLRPVHLDDADQAQADRIDPPRTAGREDAHRRGRSAASRNGTCVIDGVFAPHLRNYPARSVTTRNRNRPARRARRRIPQPVSTVPYSPRFKRRLVPASRSRRLARSARTDHWQWARRRHGDSHPPSSCNQPRLSNLLIAHC